jgi:hypothetical protein
MPDTTKSPSRLKRAIMIGTIVLSVLYVSFFFLFGPIFLFFAMPIGDNSVFSEPPSEEKVISSDFLLNQYLENINQIRTAFRFNDVDAKFVCSASHRVFPDRKDIEIPWNIRDAIERQFVNFLLFYDENDKFLVALKAGYRVWPPNDVHKLGNCTDLLIAKRLPASSLVD